jgi:hypothetical protein
VSFLPRVRGIVSDRVSWFIYMLSIVACYELPLNILSGDAVGDNGVQ